MAKKLNRRTMLRGMGIAGIAVGLPPLEAMFNSRGQYHAVGKAQAVEPPKRFVLFHWGNGAPMDYWTYASNGNFAADSILSGLLVGGMDNIVQGNYLNPITSDKSNLINIVQGVDNLALGNPSQGMPHPIQSHCFSTGTPANISGGSVVGASSISVDQLAAEYIKGDTPRASLAMVARNIGGGGEAAEIFRKAYSFGIGGADGSFYVNPLTLFDEVFAGLPSEGEEPDPALEALRARRGSILDFLKGDITALQQQLGSSDQQRLEQHLESIFELERRLSGGIRTCDLPAPPANNPPQSQPKPGGGFGDPDLEATNLQIRIEDFLQLTQLALVCDLTRSIYVSAGTTSESLVYTFLGHTVDDHGLSHANAGADPNGYQQASQIARWKVSRFARLMELLDVTPGR